MITRCVRFNKRKAARWQGWHRHRTPESPARINDPRYINICVEQINYTPVSYDWLVAKARKAMA